MLPTDCESNANHIRYVSAFAFYVYIISVFQRNVYIAQIGDGISRRSAKRRELSKADNSHKSILTGDGSRYLIGICCG